MSRVQNTNSPPREAKHGQHKLPLRYDNVSKNGIQTQIPLTRAARPQSSIASSSNSPTGEGLQFINLLGTERHSNEGRNTVRSHARRHAWKNQKQQQDQKDVTAATGRKSQHVANPKKPKQRSISVSQTVKEEPGLEPNGSCDNSVARRIPPRLQSYPPTDGYHGVFAHLPPELAKSAETALSMVHRPAIGPLNTTTGHSFPFNIQPLAHSPGSNHLMHYARGRHTSMESSQDVTLHQVGHSLSLVYASLAWTTALLASHKQWKSSESEYFIHMSITAINEDLSNVPRNGLGYNTICAVACLTNMENLNGDKQKARIHMKGLQQMIEMRGGLKELASNHSLRRLVLWADVFCATRWQSVPQFSLSDLPDLTSLPPLDEFRPPTSLKPFFAILNPSFINLVNVTGTQIICDIMRDTYELAHFLDNASTEDPSLLDRAYFPDRIYIVEHQLLSLIAQAEPQLSRDSILLPLMHALLLYIYTNIRLTPVDGRIRLTLISRLQKYVQSSDLRALNFSFPHELRWILFLGGGAASNGTPERAWFVQTMVNCGCRREWVKWEHIIMGLKGFDKSFLARCEEYWAQVGIVRGEEGHKDGRHSAACMGEENFFPRESVKD